MYVVGETSSLFKSFNPVSGQDNLKEKLYCFVGEDTTANLYGRSNYLSLYEKLCCSYSLKYSLIS
jgi:hypothetical protein